MVIKMKNKTLCGVLCVLLAMLLAFGVLPAALKHRMPSGCGSQTDTEL